MKTKLVKEVKSLEKQVSKKEKFITQEQLSILYMKKQIKDLQNENEEIEAKLVEMG